MVKYFKLDKVFSAGSDYRVEDDKYYIIHKIGTDATSDIYFTYDRWSSPAIFDVVAPLRKSTTNLLGPLDLGDLYFVLPPKVPFSIVGPAGRFLRFIGNIGGLAPGEVIPSPHLARYDVEPKLNRRYVQYTYSHGTDVSWPAGSEVTIASLTPTVREKFLLNNVLMLAVANITIGSGDAGLIFQKDTERFDIVRTEMGHLGIDALACPRPPASGNMIPFSLADKPIEVLKEEVLKFIIRNNTTAAWTPAAGTSIIWTLTFICDYMIIE